MKRILQSTLILALALAAGTTAMAQNTYHPITDGCTWSVSNEKYMTAGDTVLDGKTYLKLYRQVENQPFEFSLENAEYFAAIRDDSAERKVYAYLPAGTGVIDRYDHYHTINTGMEVLLYDFSLQMHDTISFYSIHPESHIAHEYFASRFESAFVIEGYEADGTVHYNVLQDTDSLITMSDGSTRHRILIFDGNFVEEVWIEGIGRLKGFDAPNIEVDHYPFRILLCYSDSTGTTYQTGYDFDDTDDCFNNQDYIYGVGEIGRNAISIYPNPVRNTMYISSSMPNSSPLIASVLDATGKCLISKTCSEETIMLDTRNLSSGFYFVSVKSDKQETVRKIIKL